MKKFLECWRVSKSYPAPSGGEVTIVSDFNLVIDQFEFVSLIGHSGCGKSTVLSMIAGLTMNSKGGIVLANHEIDGAGPDRGVVFQSPCLLPWLTAIENVLLGIDRVYKSRNYPQRREIAEHYLSLVGLKDAMHKRPAELSGGMQQRVGIARAFALRPKMLLLDEPFGMLDQLTRFELQQVLMELCREDHMTALMVTHDVDEAILLSDKVVMMTNGPEARVGEIVEVALPRPRLREETMEHPDYYAYRERLIGFLEAQDQHPKPARVARAVAPMAEASNDTVLAATA
jgi:nitrate ABC transporter ATP-binding subunit